MLRVVTRLDGRGRGLDVAAERPYRTYPRRAWSRDAQRGHENNDGSNPMAKRWHIRSHDSVSIAALQGAAGVPDVVAQLLICRGITDPSKARSFLEPKLKDLYDPETLPGCAAAAQRIHAAVEARRADRHLRRLRRGRHVGHGDLVSLPEATGARSATMCRTVLTKATG